VVLVVEEWLSSQVRATTSVLTSRREKKSSLGYSVVVLYLKTQAVNGWIALFSPQRLAVFYMMHTPVSSYKKVS